MAIAVAAQSNPLQPPPPAPPPPPPAVPPLAPDWRKVETPQTKPGAVGKRYRDLQHSRHERLRKYNPTLELLRGFDPQNSRFSELDGAEGDWIFSNPRGGEWPTQAVQILDRSTPDAYAMTLRLHCEDDAAACATLRDEALRLPLPRPRPTYDPATGKDLVSYRQWREWILVEPCNPGDEYRPAPRYPSSAIRSGIAGKVTLFVIVNPCGKVREALIERSSGNRDIDREAIRTLLTWRVKDHKSVIARVPVTFALDAPPAASE